jgi:hypothetical protein
MGNLQVLKAVPHHHHMEVAKYVYKIKQSLLIKGFTIYPSDVKNLTFLILQFISFFQVDILEKRAMHVGTDLTLFSFHLSK